MNKDFEKQFKQYFENSELARPLIIGGQNGLSFHWSSNIRTIETIKRSCLNNKKGNQRISYLEKSLEYLRDIPVWLASGVTKKRSNLYHVYECYMDPRLNDMWQDFKNVSISLSNDIGPYSLIRSMKWFDEKIYAQFIYIKLIRSWMPKRHFRIGLELSLDLSKVKFPLNNYESKLHQITEEGLIIQLKCNCLHHFKLNEDVVFKKNITTPSLENVSSNHFFSIENWFHLLGDFMIRGEDFSRIVEHTLKNEERETAYLFIPYTMIVSDYFAKDDIRANLDSAKKFIYDIAS